MQENCVEMWAGDKFQKTSKVILCSEWIGPYKETNCLEIHCVKMTLIAVKFVLVK